MLLLFQHLVTLNLLVQLRPVGLIDKLLTDDFVELVDVVEQDLVAVRHFDVYFVTF